MIHLSLLVAGKLVGRHDADNPVIHVGRSATNEIQIPSESVSSQHGEIRLIDVEWVFRDLKSTNGSVIERDGRRMTLGSATPEVALRPGDRIMLASVENVLVVDAIDPEVDEAGDLFDQTILAEQEIRQPTDLETTLGEDFAALRAMVGLAREMSSLGSVQAVAEAACTLSLKAFPQVHRAFFLAPGQGHYVLQYMTARHGVAETTSSTLATAPALIERCLNERKGYLFLFERDRMRAIATRIVQDEQIDAIVGGESDKVVLCCPLFYEDKCHGFLELEAPLSHGSRSSLTRRDLALATLMGHLLAARLSDLAEQVERLKLARKATAGYLAATVGHCFKNLLFVPMSISKMLPLCVREGRMAEVEWMLARNEVNIRYLDILSNEFAAASKDPSEGFEPFEMSVLLEGVAELINQIGPDKLEAVVNVPDGMASVTCHPAALKRLLMNLTLNAVDAIFGMNKNVKGRLDLSACDMDGGQRCRLTIRDNGPGMPDDILVNLRDIFRQVQASADALGELQQIAERVRSTKEQGFKEHYGLGFLFVCQTVRMHEGSMEIETQPEGTTFMIDLPRQGPSILRNKKTAG
jgi:signal transduction histidine kinase